MITNPAIIAELNRIAGDNDGVLFAEDVVQAARPESSPLHSCFQWDDTAAAEQYRLQQARQLIRVTVSYIAGDPDSRHRVYVSLSPDRTEDRGGYRSTVAVLSSPEYRKQLLADALAEMDRFTAKYQGLQELASVFDAMRKAKRKKAS